MFDMKLKTFGTWRAPESPGSSPGGLKESVTLSDRNLQWISQLKLYVGTIRKQMAFLIRCVKDHKEEKYNFWQ
jgi:hypothetical protein